MKRNYKIKIGLPAGLAAVAVCAAGFSMAAPPPGKGHSGGGPPAHAGGPPPHAGGSSSGGSGGHGQRGGSSGSDAAAVTAAALITAGITASEARGWAQQLGLVNYTTLPPGIQRNLARGKPLPPGIAKQMVPDPLLQRLPRYEGYEWIRAGTDLILIATAGAVIADVLSGVFR